MELGEHHYGRNTGVYGRGPKENLHDGTLQTLGKCRKRPICFILDQPAHHLIFIPPEMQTDICVQKVAAISWESKGP